MGFDFVWSGTIGASQNLIYQRGLKGSMQSQLSMEIKELLKEADSLSLPKTFAQAAKLRRMAAAKEKEMERNQALHYMEKTKSYDMYLKSLEIIKVSVYLVLVCWFWGVPVSIISKQLVQPFVLHFLGNWLSWGAGVTLDDRVVVGIIPWLILSTRICRCFGRKFTR